MLQKQPPANVAFSSRFAGPGGFVALTGREAAARRTIANFRRI
jgi:hypothetical protein